MRPSDLSRLLGALDARGHRRASRRRVEERQLVRAEAEQRHAERLQELRRCGHVEQRLHAGADDERLRPRQLAEVRRDVQPFPAMNAADPAGRHESDSGHAAGGEGAADGGGPDRSLDDAGREVARPDLARVAGEALQLARRETDADSAVEDADCRGRRAGLANAPVGLEPNRDTVARGETVRNERRLERDHRVPPPERVRDLAGDLDHGIAPSWATQRAAACAASSAPPTR